MNKSTNAKVSIIIVNYNGKKWLKKCFDSLLRQTYKNTEIIFVDNGSSDDSVNLIRKKYPKTIVIENKDNLGFAEANNIGYKASKGKYVLFLNNDTIVTRNFLAPLMEKLEENPENGIVQPKIILWKNKKLQSGGAFFTNTGFLYHYGYGKNPNDQKYNSPMQIFSANGSCMLVKREVVEKVGLFDGDFFFYFEETDFCHRALLVGYKVWYEPKAVIYHIGSASSQKYKYSEVAFSSFKNRITSYIKNLEAMTFIKILPVHIVLCFFAVFAYLVLGKPGNSFAILRAFGYNLIHLPQILRKRNDVQRKIRIVSDKDLLPRILRSPRTEYYLKLFSGLENYKDNPSEDK